MTLDETKQVLEIMADAYPHFGAKRNMARVAALWQNLFADDPAALVALAVKDLIATRTNSYPPVIGEVKAQLRQVAEAERQQEEKRREWVQLIAVSKAVSAGITAGAERGTAHGDGEHNWFREEWR